MPPLSIAKSIVARPWLQRVLGPVANRYADLAGYRQIGLVYVAPQISIYVYFENAPRLIWNSADDLIAEETDVVQQAIKRLPPKVAYDRMFRMRRAVQVCILILVHHLLIA
jgi:ubiquinol-cytochrome c reductase subunit 7